MHPRNRFRGGYDFQKLCRLTPALASFIGKNAYGDESIDYANPAAVKALNQALLKSAYGLGNWDIPRGYLCPPIPGRSDYLHHVADLLPGSKMASTPQGRSVAVLDIGTGANCIYPLIGAREYGWRFVGTEIDPVALRWAKGLVAANEGLSELIECRMQPYPMECFRAVIKADEVFALSMCNPPFHASAEAAAESTSRKRRNLGSAKAAANVLNFGGQAGELWCPGGELGFVRRMINQSTEVAHQCRWFTAVISKSAHLPGLYQALRDAKAVTVRTIDMAQGQKKSRILAWTFEGPG